MTFSANPARTSLRDRLRRLTGPRRALFNVLVAALLLMAGGAVLVYVLMRAVVSEQTAQFGSALASESAQRAAEYLVHNDLVSLNVITGSLSQLPGIVGITIYDRHRQPLAQSGLVQATPDTLVASADILTEENELRGTVEILLDPRAAAPALARFDYALFGWAGFAAVLLLVVARLQRDHIAGLTDEGSKDQHDAERNGLAVARAEQPAPHTPAADAVADTRRIATNDESPLARVPEGPMLRIDIINYATLEQRLAPHLLANLVALYGDMLARACAFYQGQVARPIDHQCLITFAHAGASEEEVLFRAICCAQLFFGVVRETNSALKAHGKTTMQFTAALHHDQRLATGERAIVTWEICTQAGTAGRLTVTDTVTDYSSLGERLVIDASHRQLLQIELPNAGEGAARLQDVLALGVLRLADPYEELLARQIKRLCEPTAA